MQLPTNDFGGTVVGPPLHYRDGWWLRTWRALRETANPNTMHTEDLTAVELERQASFESLDYYKPYPDMYVRYLRESHEGRWHHYAPRTHVTASAAAAVESADAVQDGADEAERRTNYYGVGSPLESFARLQMDEAERHVTLRWLLHVVIALSVGIVATVVSYAVDILESYRAEALYRVMTHRTHRSVGFLYGLLYTVAGSLVLVVVAAGVVVYFEPAASGGGIPDVMAYLNGVHMRKAMNLRTFIAKAISCVCAVAGGLPVGLEAPLIHLGAITGAGVTQGRSRTLGFQTSLFQAFRNSKDRRDFITAGAACGVSVAFGAPIGGLLFVMEEVSSFWDQSSNGQIFLATMLCFTFSTIINSIVEDRRLLGWVSNAAAVLFEVNLTIPLHLVSIVPSLLLGIVIGSLAALFTKANLLLVTWRRRVLRPHPLRRFLEPVVIGAIFSACMYLLSLASPCAELHPIHDHNTTVHQWGTEAGRRLFNNTCNASEAYSPLGTLTMASGKNTIRHLFSRQTAEEFPVVTLVVYFLVYFAAACVTSGTAVSGGLVVPSLVIGAVFGRLYGLLLFKLGATSVQGVPRGYPSTDAWMDPGVFALIGAGAFLAGTSRMSMAICVIMVELSAELHYLLPVMVAIVMAKTVADWLCEPLYHQMLRMDCVPYLPPNIVRAEFEQLTAADVMAAEVVTLRVLERTEVVLAALRDSTHHAFPVVAAVPMDGDHHDSGKETTAVIDAPAPHSRGASKSTASPPAAPAPGAGAPAAAPTRYKFVGLVTREDLQVYFTLPELQEYDASLSSSPTVAAAAAVAPVTSGVPLSDPDSDGFGGRLASCVLAIRRLTWTQWTWQKSKLFFTNADRYEWVRTHMPDGAPGGVEVGSDGMSFISENRLPPVLDLALIVNRSPWVIPPFFNLQMAYQTFRMMGLRHMVVVDGDTVAGMITRKDLLVDSLRRRMKELRARLATTGATAPSFPPSYTQRVLLGDPPQRSRSEESRARADDVQPATTAATSTTASNAAALVAVRYRTAAANGDGTAPPAARTPLRQLGLSPLADGAAATQPAANSSSPLSSLFSGATGGASPPVAVRTLVGPGLAVPPTTAHKTANPSPPRAVAPQQQSTPGSADVEVGPSGSNMSGSTAGSAFVHAASASSTPPPSLPRDAASLFDFSALRTANSTS
ncbi:chloride channel protein [Novymonas esmeraldas]|uniref:Chloride channel protein n=1 Tax=Novymonas esmeraldas TaxID=1808958 RepID=A0AAW0FDC5_9TRYP